MYCYFVQLPGNDCTDTGDFDPTLFTVVVAGAIGYGGTGTEDPDTISAATCEQLKALDPLITSCCTETTVTPMCRLLDGVRNLQDISQAPLMANTTTAPSIAPSIGRTTTAPSGQGSAPPSGAGGPTPVPPTPVPPTPVPPTNPPPTNSPSGSIVTQSTVVVAIPPEESEGIQEIIDQEVENIGSEISEVTDPEGGGVVTSASASPSFTPSAMPSGL